LPGRPLRQDPSPREQALTRWPASRRAPHSRRHEDSRQPSAPARRLTPPRPACPPGQRCPPLGERHARIPKKRIPSDHEIAGRDAGGQDLHPDLTGPGFGEVLFHSLQDVRPTTPRHDDATMFHRVLFALVATAHPPFGLLVSFYVQETIHFIQGDIELERNCSRSEQLRI
jgi:hypothetical protein